MPPEAIVRKECTIEVLAKTATGGRIRINTASFDRDEDRVFPSGAQVASYLLNPVVQWGHNYKDYWSTIGRTKVMDLSGDVIDVDFDLRPAFSEFDPQKIIIGLWEGGWVKTASIGFKPLTYKANNGGGYDFTSWELLEWSLVPIPANQDALRLSVKGVDGLLTEQDLLASNPVDLVVVNPEGASVPLADYLQGLAKEKDAQPEEVKELSLDRWVDAVSNALYSALWEGHGYDGVRRHIVAIYPTYAIVCIGLTFYRVDYDLVEGMVVLADQAAWIEVEQEWAELSVTLETIGRSWAQKAGARHSKSDMEKIQGMHDMACDLGAACETASAGEDMDDEKSKGVVDDGEGDTQIDAAEQANINDLETAITNLRSVLGR